jgi:hypothetical protein
MYSRNIHRITFSWKIMKNTLADFHNLSDYLPILNGSIIADLIVIFIVYYTRFFNSKYLMKWYETYRLSAVIADVLILVIGVIIARYIYSKLFSSFSLWKFLLILVGIQIVHDILFYGAFMTIPKGVNKMMDVFKEYAGEVGGGAVLGDSFMIIITGLLSYFLQKQSLHTNILTLIVSVYLIPYILYTR